MNHFVRKVREVMSRAFLSPTPPAQLVDLSQAVRIVIPGKMAFSRGADGVFYREVAGVAESAHLLRSLVIAPSVLTTQSIKLAGFVDSEEVAWLEDWLRGTARTFVPSHIGLFTTTPADDGTGGVEATGGSYAREAFARNGTNWGAPTGTAPVVAANLLALPFTTATASWGTITAWGYFNAVSAGNLGLFAVLDATKLIDNGDTANFPIGSLTVAVGDPGDTF